MLQAEYILKHNNPKYNGKAEIAVTVTCYHYFRFHLAPAAKDGCLRPECAELRT